MQIHREFFALDLDPFLLVFRHRNSRRQLIFLHLFWNCFEGEAGLDADSASEHPRDGESLSEYQPEMPSMRWRLLWAMAKFMIGHGGILAQGVRRR